MSGKRLFNETISSVNTRPHTLVDWSADEVKACSLFYLDVIQVIKFIEHIEYPLGAQIWAVRTRWL